MGTKDSQCDEISSVVEAKLLPTAKYISDTNSENAPLCGEDDLLPEQRKKIKKKEKKRIDSAVSSNYEATPGIMEESGNTDLVVRKSKKGKRRSEEQEDAKEDSIKESIELATETSEVNPTHSKKKKKEKWGGEDPESQTTCNGDAKVHESNVEPVLKISSKPDTVEANDSMDLSFSKKKKKKRKPKLEEDQAPEVAVLGIDGVKESVNLTSARASKSGADAGDATGERNLILEKKMNKVKHSTGDPEFQEFCSGDAISADGEAIHSKKKKKKEKNHSVETDGKNCSKGDGDCPTEDVDITEQGEIQANNVIRSGPSKKRKKENNYSKETDERCSREHDGICPIEGPDCSKQDAESAEIKSVRSKKRKKEKSCSEETDDKHCREEGVGTSPIKASDCCDQVAKLGVTQANDEMKFAHIKKRKKEKHQNVVTDAQPQTGEDDNVPEKGESSASHGPKFVQKNPNKCCTATPAEGSHREKEDDQHGVKGGNGGSYGFSLKEKKKKKKHCNDENTVEGREPGNVVDECHTTETNYEDKLAPLEKKKRRDRKKSKGTEKQHACVEESNTEKALGMDSQAVELVMEHTEQCSDNTLGTGTQANGETSFVPSKKKKNNEKKRRKENEDQPIPVEDSNLRGTLTDRSFKGDHTEHVHWKDQLARHSSESKAWRRWRRSHEKRDRWLRFPKENSAKEDLFRSYLVKDSSSEHPESGTAPEQISEATSICIRKDDDFSLKDSEEKIKKQEKQVDEVSASSEFYMSAGVSVNKEIIPNVGYSSTGVALGHSRKKLLILDVNGILVDIVPVVIGNYKPSFILSRKPVFKRPFMDDFLQFCFEHFSVGFWSSRIRKNLNQIVNFLMGDLKRKLLFCWDQSHCTKTGFQTVENRDKPLVLKELRKLWDKLEPDLPWSKGDYNESNTLLLDDSPYKALLNPTNTGIFPYSYRYTNAEDNSLGPGGELRVYLEGLAKADNVQSFVRDNPFGQKAITESSTSWKFYERVIGQIPKEENPPRYARSHSCSSRREYPRHDDRLPPPRESRLPREARRSLSPQPLPQPQPQHQHQPQHLHQPQPQPQPQHHHQHHHHHHHQPQPQHQPLPQSVPQHQPQPLPQHQPQPLPQHQPQPLSQHQPQPLPQHQPPPLPQHQPPQDTRYYRSLQREHLPYDDRFSRPPPMGYPVGEITQPIFPGHHQDAWHSRPHLREYSHHNTQFCHPSPRTYQLPETRQPYWDTRHYQPHPPWLYRDKRHYQPPLREYGHWDDRRYGRSEYGPRPRWH